MPCPSGRRSGGPACVAAEALGPEPSPEAAAALEAARAWVIDPKDEKRRATFPAAEAAEMGTPAGCTAAAAYFSGGSLAPPNLPASPRPSTSPAGWSPPP